MKIKEKIAQLKAELNEEIKKKAVGVATVAATIAPMAPTSAEAATPASPEQPKTEQYAPNQTPDNNNDKKTLSIGGGIYLTPVDEVPNSNQQPTRSPSNQRRQTNTRQTTPSVRALQEGTPEWALANGWELAPELLNGLNELGARGGKGHHGYQGVYVKIDDPHKVMVLPNDIRDGIEYWSYKNIQSAQENGNGPYNHYNHDKYGHGCPDKHPVHVNPKVRDAARAVRIIGTAIDALTRGGR